MTAGRLIIVDLCCWKKLCFCFFLLLRDSLFIVWALAVSVHPKQKKQDERLSEVMNGRHFNVDVIKC